MATVQDTLICYLTIVCLLLHSSSPSAEGQIRLVGGSSSCSGRVEVYGADEWRTVCDDHWDWSDAAVVCRQMKCGKVMKATHRAWFGEGTGPVWLNHVDCLGSESSLTDCHHDRFGDQECDHSEDAGVVCSGMQAYMFLEDYLLALMIPAAVGGLLLPLLFVILYLLPRERFKTSAVPSEIDVPVLASKHEEGESTYEALQKGYTDDYEQINTRQIE